MEETYRILHGARIWLWKIPKIPVKHIRRSPWVIFTRFNDNPPLCENTLFLNSLLKRITNLNSSRAILTLAQQFLRYYPTDKKYFKTLRTTISKMVEKCESYSVKKFRQRSDFFKFFKPDCPTLFGNYILTSTHPVKNILDSAGLEGPLARNGLITHIYFHMCNDIEGQILSKKIAKVTLKKALDFFTIIEGRTEKLRFPNGKNMLAEALLLPYQEIGPYNPEIQNIIQDFIIKHFGDPRISRTGWYGVSEVAQTVMMRWLVSLTLEDFFNLLSYSARLDPDALRHWPERKKFWSAYLKRGYITDAWVALGERIGKAAPRFLKYKDQQYARLMSGGGARSNHSVLIMKIGNMIIAEWSHMGTCRIWFENSTYAPQFYKLSYVRSELVARPDWSRTHHKNWQRRIAEYIEDWTGIRVKYREYML